MTSVATSAAATSAADLVAVQGNSYATVALLGLGSRVDDEPAPARRPDLANRFPLGETTPLSRFMSGQVDALRQFRGSAIDEAPAADPWHEDLFQRPLLRTPAPLGPSPEETEDEPGEVNDTLALALALFTFSARSRWDGMIPIPRPVIAKRKQDSPLPTSPADE